MKNLPLYIAAVCLASAAQAVPVPPAAAPYLDLTIEYYSKVLTPEGVTREARYQEKMIRRPGHVWVARVLPKNAADQHEHKTKQAQHKHFNPVMIARHVMLENGKLRVQYIAANDKEIVNIPASEYEVVNFDGSWENTYYLLDPKLVNAMPLSARASQIPGARWREREKDGVYQRVLWDDRNQIARIIESGDQGATFYRRVEVTLQVGLARDLPWQNLKGFAQKEYADFLD